MMKTVLAALCLAMATTIAWAEEAPATSTTPTGTQTTPDTPPTAENPTAPKGDDQIVCKKEPPPIGSRMGGKKVCHTVAEWRRIEAAARETTDEIQKSKVPPPAN